MCICLLLDIDNMFVAFDFKKNTHLFSIRFFFLFFLCKHMRIDYDNISVDS